MDYSLEFTELKKISKQLEQEKKQINKLYHDRETYLIERNKEKVTEVMKVIKERKITFANNKKDFLLKRKNHIDNLKKDKVNNKQEIIATKRLCLMSDKIYSFKEWIKYRFKEQPMLIGRDLVCVLSVLNLALSLAYIQAIAQISNRTSGLLMFGFILFGLISIFNTLRLKEAYSGKYYFVTSILILAAAMGISLGVVCLMGMRVGLKNSLIQKGAFQAIIISVGYIIGFIFIFIARKKEKKQYLAE